MNDGMWLGEHIYQFSITLGCMPSAPIDLCMPQWCNSCTIVPCGLWEYVMKKCGLIVNLSEFEMFCKWFFVRRNLMSIFGLQLHSKDWTAEQWQQYEINRWKLTLIQGLLLSCNSSMRLNVGQLTLPVIKILLQTVTFKVLEQDSYQDCS